MALYHKDDVHNAIDRLTFSLSIYQDIRKFNRHWKFINRVLEDMGAGNNDMWCINNDINNALFEMVPQARHMEHVNTFRNDVIRVLDRLNETDYQS